MFGLRGPALIGGALAPDCARCTAAELESHLQAVGPQLDVDGDGDCEALSDGLLLERWLFGIRGITLVSGAVDALECTRCTAPEIEDYIANLD